MIKWNEVTWYSQIAAIALFIVVFAVGFFFGKSAEQTKTAEAVRKAVAVVSQGEVVEKPLSDVVFTCNNKKTIETKFYKDRAYFSLSDGRRGTLPLLISVSGTSRYANKDESFVFWTKGKGASIQEGATTTYAGCVTP